MTVFRVGCLGRWSRGRIGEWDLCDPCLIQVKRVGLETCLEALEILLETLHKSLTSP